jgi:hypothetical protein
MDYKALWDYADALLQQSYRLERDSSVEKAAVFERYSNAVNSAAGHVQFNTLPNREDAQSYARDLRRLFSPREIEQHIPEHRRAEVYRATSALASAMERAAAGKSPRRFFGLFG